MSKSQSTRLARLEASIKLPTSARMFVADQDLDNDDLFSAHEIHPELADRLNVPEEPDVIMTRAELDELAAQGHTVILIIRDLDAPLPNEEIA